MSPHSSPVQQNEQVRQAAHAALERGEHFIVAVGGDRVVHEVINGIFQDGVPPEPPILGVVPAGMDNEFFHQFGLPFESERACAHLAGEQVFPIDVGRITCVDPDGKDHSRYFMNIGDVGLGARMATPPDEPTRSRGRQFAAFWSALLRTRSAEVHVEAARKTYDGRAHHVVVGNGRFGPGGFRVSPRSFPGDGVFEVLVHHGPKSQAFVSLPRAYRGEQVPSPHITELRGSTVRVEADPPMPVAVDGILIGRTPATFENLPQALLLKV